MWLVEAVRDLMVDLKFQGDYTPDSRKLVQALLARNDLKQLAAVIGDKAKWSSVPPDQFNPRKVFMTKAVGD